MFTGVGWGERVKHPDTFHQAPTETLAAHTTREAGQTPPPFRHCLYQQQPTEKLRKGVLPPGQQTLPNPRPAHKYTLSAVQPPVLADAYSISLKGSLATPRSKTRERFLFRLRYSSYRPISPPHIFLKSTCTISALSVEPIRILCLSTTRCHLRLRSWKHTKRSEIS